MREIWEQFRLGGRAIGRMVRHPRHQALFFALLFYVAVGVGFYSWQEGWSLVDSFYFTVVELGTVGFGDLVPTTTVTRFFTAVYLIFGLVILGAVGHAVVQSATSRLPGPNGQAARSG